MDLPGTDPGSSNPNEDPSAPSDGSERPAVPVYDRDYFYTKVREALENPEETARRNAANAAKMGIDSEAVMQRWGLKSSISVSVIPPSVPPVESTIGRDAGLVDTDQVSSFGVGSQVGDADLFSGSSSASPFGFGMWETDEVPAEHDVSTSWNAAPTDTNMNTYAPLYGDNMWLGGELPVENAVSTTWNAPPPTNANMNTYVPSPYGNNAWPSNELPVENNVATSSNQLMDTSMNTYVPSPYGNNAWSSNELPVENNVSTSRSNQPMDTSMNTYVPSSPYGNNAWPSDGLPAGNNVSTSWNAPPTNANMDTHVLPYANNAYWSDRLPAGHGASTSRSALPMNAGMNTVGQHRNAPTWTTSSQAGPAPMDTGSLFVNKNREYPILEFPQSYKDISPSNLKMKELAKRRSPSHTSLESLKNCIGRCQNDIKRRVKEEFNFDELRNHVHKAEFLPDISVHLVKLARILTVENGLPRIFGDVFFPWDLRADAYQLYARWMRGEFEQNVLRGIITVKGSNRASDRIDPEYRAEHPKTAKFYGHGGLVIGQCWPSQLCAVRDGAHGSSQGGIFGEKGKGAYSIVLSGGAKYNDIDEGELIIYHGTEGKDGAPTEATQHMITSHGLNNDIRVFRSHQLPMKNRFRPEIGLRYDGLYKIQSYEFTFPEKQMYSFSLARVSGQHPIRYGDNLRSRPTDYEIEEYRKLKGKI